MGRSTLIKDNSLMQPFLPGTPVGRGPQGSGKAPRVSDENWRRAFPNCKHNRLLGEDTPPMSYEQYLRRKLGVEHRATRDI